MRCDQTLAARWRWRGAASVVVVLALVSSSFVAGADDDDRHSRGPKHATGSVRYPCANPAFTRTGMTPNGVCGYRFDVTPGASYRVAPLKPADIDIHFVSAAGEYVRQNAGGPNECGELHGTVHDDAVKAIVVTSPSACSARPGGAYEGSQVNVSFAYAE